jgi:phage gp36-like protein
MSYATPSQLRERYRRGLDSDEFAAEDDAKLDSALNAAAVEIDSWRPAAVLSDAALEILADKALTLARLHLHQDEALDPIHPIVREAEAVRTWLKALSRGEVNLPINPEDPVPSSPVVPLDTGRIIYNDAWSAKYRQVAW